LVDDLLWIDSLDLPRDAAVDLATDLVDLWPSFWPRLPQRHALALGVPADLTPEEYRALALRIDDVNDLPGAVHVPQFLCDDPTEHQFIRFLFWEDA
jgi:hypothetical protein